MTGFRTTVANGLSAVKARRLGVEPSDMGLEHPLGIRLAALQMGGTEELESSLTRTTTGGFDHFSFVPSASTGY